MVRLDDLMGKSLTLAIAGEKRCYAVTLHGVETGGIWIESADFEKFAPILRKKGKAGEPSRRPVFFLPFAQIHFLISESVVL